MFSIVYMEPGEEGGGVESTQTNGNELVGGDEEVRLQFKLLNEREWYFQDISYEQIELILKQREENTFLVTNGAFEDQFVLYMSIKSTLGDHNAEMKTITLLRNRHEGKYTYRFEDKEDEFPNVVEAVVSFVNCSEFELVPAIASHVTLRQESIQSQGSNEVDLPPNYTAAANFPGVTQQLPVIQAKVDVEKGEDADAVTTPVQVRNFIYDMNDLIAHDFNSRPLDRWSTHVHYYQDLHCCHPKNTWHFCCHRGYHSYGSRRGWYSIRGSGICRTLCVLLFYCLVVVCCPFIWPCFLVYVCYICLLFCTYGEDD